MKMQLNIKSGGMKCRKKYQSIMNNDVWEIIPRLSDKLIVTLEWIYKIKHGTYGSIGKYKARFAEKGFSQKERIDYKETFALIAQYTTILIVSLVSTIGWNIHQMNVKTYLLNGTIDEEVYIEKPHGFEIN